MRGEDIAAVVSHDTRTDDVACSSMQALVSRPFRWVDKHDVILLLAHMPYDLESVKRYLDFYQLLVCSSEWLEFRLGQLLRDGKEDKDIHHL